MSAHYIKGHSHRIGIITAREDTQSCTIAVLPKIWNKESKQVTARWIDDQAIFHVYENQSLEIIIDDSSPHIKQRESLINTLLQKAEDDAKQRPSKKQDVEEYKKPKPLISRVGSFSTEAQSEQEETNTEHSTQRIIHLLLLLQHSKIDIGANIQTKKIQDELLTPLIHSRYVRELERNRQHFRRGYIPRSQQLSAIRGRVDAYSAAMVQQSGDTQVLCHYDEFAMASPLLRILVTALDVVARGNWLSRWKQDTPKNWGAVVQNQGAYLRKYLQSIPSFSINQAIQKSYQIRLNRLEQPLENTLALAKLVLERSQSIFSAKSDISSHSWIWSVDMSDIWEQILVQGYQKAFEHTENIVVYYDRDKASGYEGFPQKILGPFTGSGERYPDILLRYAQKNWIVDAKYSLRVSKKDNLYKVLDKATRDQQFQMFVYAHLTRAQYSLTSGMQVETKPWTDELALIFPTFEEEPIRGKEPAIINEWSYNDSPPRLHLFAFHFPSFETDGNDTSNATRQWETYITTLSQQLQDYLEDSSD